MKLIRIVAAAMTLVFAAGANAAIVSVDLTDVASWDGIGDADNVVFSIDLGPGAIVTGIGWDVTITPAGLSWYSEAIAGISDSGGGQLFELAPGILDGGDSGDGIARSYSSGGIMNLAANGLSSLVLADGLLLIEFFESFDDSPGAVDAFWGGTLSFQVVPLPATVWLFGSALLGLAGWSRRQT